MARGKRLLMVSGEVDANEALYIKLGEGGKWEKECIEDRQTLRIGFEQVPHPLCSAGNWAEVAALLRSEGYPAQVASGFTKQIQLFYEAGRDTLWFTLCADRLWWCFSEPRVTVLPDGSRTRPVLDRWMSCDVQGRPLDIIRLSGRLVMVRRYQGTICSVGHERLEYLTRKINARNEPEVDVAKSARSSLQEAVETIVSRLHWRDFELLVDLIFRQAGWMRVGELGGTQKTLDLVLVSPITAERYGVQVKAQGDLVAFEEYEREVGCIEGFSHFYFAVHSPSPDLEEMKTTGKVQLLRPAEVAELSVKYGLVDWVIDKAG